MQLLATAVVVTKVGRSLPPILSCSKCQRWLCCILYPQITPLLLFWLHLLSWFQWEHVSACNNYAGHRCWTSSTSSDLIQKGFPLGILPVKKKPAYTIFGWLPSLLIFPFIVLRHLQIAIQRSPRQHTYTSLLQCSIVTAMLNYHLCSKDRYNAGFSPGY